jgi:hypothetical protein
MRKRKYRGLARAFGAILLESAQQNGGALEFV